MATPDSDDPETPDENEHAAPSPADNALGPGIVILAWRQGDTKT